MPVINLHTCRGNKLAILPFLFSLDNGIQCSPLLQWVHIHKARESAMEHTRLVRHTGLDFLSCRKDWSRDDAESRKQHLHMLRYRGVHDRVSAVPI